MIRITLFIAVLEAFQFELPIRQKIVLTLVNSASEDRFDPVKIAYRNPQNWVPLYDSVYRM
jgi:hypothetical protein